MQINYEKKRNYMQETVEVEVIKALQKEGIKLCM